MIFKSRWVLPKRLLESGFVFEYGEIGGGGEGDIGVR
ncbi:DUF1731 domain-containing protein [Mucilaginibacter sp. BJC16-A38]|nr:DUF1731 domain-containing protein [Mucilaginibacter phenanthrenivorans]